MSERRRLSRYQDIYDIVKRVPTGTVTSYGRIARMLNCTARQVGYALAAVPDDQAIPWHRVINSKGQVSTRKQGHGDQRQRQKLIDEGILFDSKGRVSFEQFGWAAESSKARSPHRLADDELWRQRRCHVGGNPVRQVLF